MNNITILNFSSRKNGNCSYISQFIQSKYENSCVNAYTVVQRIGPCNNCDYECLQPGKCCPNVTDYLKQIMESALNSGLIYFIIPNFCGGPCASYYAFNERIVGYFGMDRGLRGQYMSIKKRFIIVSNTEGQLFDLAMQQQTNDEPDVLYLKSGKYGKRSIAGDILESEMAQADLEQFLAAYAPEP